ncbi:type II toxin-antitoxin system PemK/MazF family toxin [Bacillus sp. FJAT-49705]|uniref:Type II toxin-antitoxin system PemK/MazF family toxin n=1 Tax=Cytobacillus citreus TaxID=2833586 RepID=A0ABS5NUT6_9BACI|nr:type II toxin-antitoxin system PemK/MazF family toxin [Cytobacillus citreus]MBS4191204.1 type II toxin-antitoxin system PemK/MazF family toxin [Cytobacillus citreus]
MNVNIGKVLSLLKNKRILNDKALSNNDLKKEIANSSFVTKKWYENITVEQAIKSILWQGTLKDYGTFGYKTHLIRKYNKDDGSEFHFNQTFSRGKMLSIDFGVTNIGREFSLTHTGIVIADYTSMVVVVPLTSQNSINLDKVPTNIKKTFIPVYKKDYPQLENDSYIQVHQIKSVSKNRITRKGIIGSLANTPIMEELEMALIKSHSPYANKLLQEQIDSLSKQNEELITKLIEQEKIINGNKTVDI